MPLMSFARQIIARSSPARAPAKQSSWPSAPLTFCNAGLPNLRGVFSPSATSAMPRGTSRHAFDNAAIRVKLTGLTRRHSTLSRKAWSTGSVRRFRPDGGRHPITGSRRRVIRLSEIFCRVLRHPQLSERGPTSLPSPSRRLKSGWRVALCPSKGSTPRPPRNGRLNNSGSPGCTDGRAAALHLQ